MRVTVTGTLGAGVTSKDIIMALIEKIGASGATGYAIEFAGPVISALSVEARMTICNMAVEAGARGAFMAPDEKVYDYLKSKPRAPQGEHWNVAEKKWRERFTDEGAVFDREVRVDVDALEPMVTWGTARTRHPPSVARFQIQRASPIRSCARACSVPWPIWG